jgi:hypothetical protein
MSFYCAVCNGMESVRAKCPKCKSPVTDHGRFNDFLGPYAPYRDIEDISMTNGFFDVRNHECIHVLSCPNCRKTFTLGFPEWEQ